MTFDANGIKLIFGVGAGYRTDGSAISTTMRESMVARAKSYLVEIFGGYTLSRVYGGWKSPKNGLVEEVGYSIFITLPAVSPLAKESQLSQLVAMVISDLKLIFDQEAIYVEVQPVWYTIE